MEGLRGIATAIRPQLGIPFNLAKERQIAFDRRDPVRQRVPLAQDRLVRYFHTGEDRFRGIKRADRLVTDGSIAPMT